MDKWGRNNGWVRALQTVKTRGSDGRAVANQSVAWLALFQSRMRQESSFTFGALIFYWLTASVRIKTTMYHQRRQLMEVLQ